MASPIAIGALLLGLAVQDGIIGLPGRLAPMARAAVAASPVHSVQFREGRSPASRSLFERPSLGQPGSLFRPRSFRLGPHYEPPAVVYEPPPVVYEPPTVTGRPSFRDDRIVGPRCAPRTRAWYQSCAARFRSFDPNRGTYNSFSGQERPCRCP